jgi:ketosteroid isomerase-like protein
VPAVRYIIDSLNNRIASLIAAGQPDSASMLFASDVWQMPPNMMPLVGRDSLRTFWTNMTTNGKVEFDLQTQDVIAADSIAVERGSYNLKYAARPGATIPSFVDHGNYVVLWRQDADGHWRIVWDAPVSTVPMPASPPSPRPR